MQMHKLRLWSSFSCLLASYLVTWAVTSKSKKNRSTSNQVGNTFQTLFFTNFATDRQNSYEMLYMLAAGILESWNHESRLIMSNSDEITSQDW